MGSSYNENVMLKTLYVDSVKVPCQGGSGTQECLRVKDYHHEEFGNMYESINGFQFEPGYMYKLLVKVEDIPKEEIMADSASATVTLVSVVSKTPVEVEYRSPCGCT